MNNFFNPENKIMVALGRVGDYVLLNVLWIFCSIPIVTIGASTTAMYYASLKLLANEETYISKDFFHSFRENFRQATLLWLLFLVIGALCVVDLIFYRQLDSTVGVAAFTVFLSLSIIYLITLLYLFPYLSRFYCTFKEAIRSAFLLSIRHLGYTVLMVATDALLVVAAFYASVLIMFLPTLTCFANSLIFRRIFSRYLPKDDGDGDAEEEFATIDEIEARDRENSDGTPQ